MKASDNYWRTCRVLVNKSSRMTRVCFSQSYTELFMELSTEVYNRGCHLDCTFSSPSKMHRRLIVKNSKKWSHHFYPWIMTNIWNCSCRKIFWDGNDHLLSSCQYFVGFCPRTVTINIKEMQLLAHMQSPCQQSSRLDSCLFLPIFLSWIVHFNYRRRSTTAVAIWTVHSPLR